MPNEKQLFLPGLEPREQRVVQGISMPVSTRNKLVQLAEQYESSNSAVVTRLIDIAYAHDFGEQVNV